MTKKHYEIIADAFNITDNNKTERSYRVILAHRVANRLQADNPRFDREKFLSACGVNN